jgi:hypothetical protein
MENLAISQLLPQIETYDVKKLWYDWFCKDSSLKNKGMYLLKKLKAISKSSKFDNDKCYVFFKNGCTSFGKLYDEFKICDIETHDVIYDVIPNGWGNDGCPEVWGEENDFEEPIVKFDSWKELKAWFLK